MTQQSFAKKEKSCLGGDTFPQLKPEDKICVRVFLFPLKLWMLFHPDQQKKWTFSNQFELTNGENLPGTVAFISECHDTAGDPAKSSSRMKFSPKENERQQKNQAPK